MTQEQYNRAAEINNRLSSLYKVKGEISRYNTVLGYFYRTQYLFKDLRIIDEDIRNILDRHDKMIREGIDSEIEKLKKEIDEL